MKSECRHCITEYFNRDDAHLYPEPTYGCATAWCPLYERILLVVSKSIPATAAMLSRVRTSMKNRLEKQHGGQLFGEER